MNGWDKEIGISCYGLLLQVERSTVSVHEHTCPCMQYCHGWSHKSPFRLGNFRWNCPRHPIHTIPFRITIPLCQCPTRMRGDDPHTALERPWSGHPTCPIPSHPQIYLLGSDRTIPGMGSTIHCLGYSHGNSHAPCKR